MTTDPGDLKPGVMFRREGEMDEGEYKKELKEFFASKGGVPKEFGMFAAQGWY